MKLQQYRPTEEQCLKHKAACSRLYRERQEELAMAVVLYTHNNTQNARLMKMFEKKRIELNKQLKKDGASKVYTKIMNLMKMTNEVSKKMKIDKKIYESACHKYISGETTNIDL